MSLVITLRDLTVARHVDVEPREVASAHHPNHYCGPRLLQSTYGPDGFNAVAFRLTGRNLWWVFQPTEEAMRNGGWQPTSDELRITRARAVDLQAALRGAATTEEPLDGHLATADVVVEFVDTALTMQVPDIDWSY